MKSIVLFSLVFFTVLVCCMAKYREFYEILGISPSSSQAEIKKAYRKLSVQLHPDQNQDDPNANDKFAKLANAYEVLSDPDKRRKYDQYGEEGLKTEGSYQDMWSQFFGGQNQEHRGPIVIIKLAVSLEDIYNGKEISFFQTKSVLCPHCRGTGADDPDDITQCPNCKGQGWTLQKQQIAFGFWQQFQMHCDKCDGKGKIFTSKCHVCHQSKTLPGYEVLSLQVEKGVPNGHKIVYEMAGNEYFDRRASDLVFQVVEAQHERFTRVGNNLYTKITLSLKEALLGFERTIKHLDGHVVNISRDFVTQPNDVDKVAKQGMPHHDYPSMFGDLFVEYIVELPSYVDYKKMELWEDFFADK